VERSPTDRRRRQADQIKAPRDLARGVGDANAGRKLELTLSREGKDRTAMVALGKPAQAEMADANPQEGTEESGPRLGLGLSPITPRTSW
jgi:serine protease Do